MPLGVLGFSSIQEHVTQVLDILHDFNGEEVLDASVDRISTLGLALWPGAGGTSLCWITRGGGLY